MAIGKDVRLDRDPLAHRALGRGSTAVDLRRDPFDDHPLTALELPVRPDWGGSGGELGAALYRWAGHSTNRAMIRPGGDYVGAGACRLTVVTGANFAAFLVFMYLRAITE